jgi:hypothetical protein
MKHAGAEALDRLEPLLRRVRGLEGVVEKSRGVFHRGSRAFLHFHEDPQGLFADVRTASGWKRLKVGAPPQERSLLCLAAEAVRGAKARADASAGRGRGAAKAPRVPRPRSSHGGTGTSKRPP